MPDKAPRLDPLEELLDDHLRISEIARLENVCYDTCLAWAKRGEFGVLIKTGAGRWRVSRAQYLASRKNREVKAA